MRTARRKVLFLLLALPFSTPVAAQQWPAREGHVVAADGVRLHWKAYGDRGDTIVFLHGGPGGQLASQLDKLSELARTHVVIGYTQRGGAGSEVTDTTTLTVDRHVADIEAVRRHFGLERMTLYGHSWGAALALLYADAHPGRVDRLILNGAMTPARIPFDAERWTAVGARMSEYCRARLGSAADSVVARCVTETPVALIYYAGSANAARSRARGGADPVGQRVGLRSLGDWDFRPAMARVDVPALVIEGAQTPIPLEHFRIWARTMPDARFLAIEGAGHGYASVEQPAAFFGALRMFLDGAWPDGAVELRRTTATTGMD